jgi:hypothetical protein
LGSLCKTVFFCLIHRKPLSLLSPSCTVFICPQCGSLCIFSTVINHCLCLSMNHLPLSMSPCRLKTVSCPLSSPSGSLRLFEHQSFLSYVSVAHTVYCLCQMFHGPCQSLAMSFCVRVYNCISLYLPVPDSLLHSSCLCICMLPFSVSLFSSLSVYTV